MLFLHLGLLSLEVIIDDSLLLDVVQELVTDHVSIVNRISDGRVPRSEVVYNPHHSLQVFVRQDGPNAIRVLRIFVFPDLFS